MTDDKISDLAAKHGLELAYALDPDAFASAVKQARALSERIAKPNSFTDEPAHVLKLSSGRKADAKHRDNEP